MKAQGLPINFIVIAALAILILILAAGFVIAGGAAFGGAVGPEQARSTCNSFCVNSQRSAADVYDSTLITNWKTGIKDGGSYEQRFCTATFDVKGYAPNTTCSDLVGTCLVTFGDGTTFAMTGDACGHNTTII